MSRKTWKLLLPAVLLALSLSGPLAAEEAALPDAAPEVTAETVTPAPAETPEIPELQPAPVPMTDCYSLSTCTPSFAACESWCYGQNCGINYWDPGPQICYCGTKF